MDRSCRYVFRFDFRCRVRRKYFCEKFPDRCENLMELLRETKEEICMYYAEYCVGWDDFYPSVSINMHCTILLFSQELYVNFPFVVTILVKSYSVEHTVSKTLFWSSVF